MWIMPYNAYNTYLTELPVLFVNYFQETAGVIGLEQTDKIS